MIKIFNNTATIELTQSESCAITYLRAFSMLLIIACHICQSYHTGWEYILNIGVQIFFLISGLLHGFKRIKRPINWYVAKFKKVFVPYYIYILIVLPILSISSSNIIFGKTAAIYLTDTQWIMGGVNGLGQLWFMTGIALCYLITPILQPMRNFGVIIVPSLLIATFIYYFTLHTDSPYYSAIFLYITGYYTINLSRRFRSIVGVICFITIVAITSFASFDFTLLLQKAPNPINRTIHDFMAISIVFICLNIFAKKNYINIDIVTRKIAQYSFMIYLVHGLYCTGSPFSIINALSIPWIAVPLFLFCTIISAIGLNIVSGVVTNFITKSSRVSSSL